MSASSEQSTAPEELRAWRQEHQVSQRVLAVAIHTTSQAISNYETRRTVPDTVAMLRLEHVCGISPRSWYRSVDLVVDESALSGVSARDGDRHVSLSSSPSLTAFDDLDRECLMTREDFTQCVRSGGIMDDDGSGYLAVADAVSDVMISPSRVSDSFAWPRWATHVCWYNK